MKLEIYRHRSKLTRLMKAIKNSSITLGFIGGSITDPRTGNRWPEYVISWFTEKFPNVLVTVENAAIGATGSDLAVFRAERDLINRNCDIVFIEYAVNDWDAPVERRKRSREGLIRKLLKEEMDLILVYTYNQQMYSDMIQEIVPDSIREFEDLAEHYHISSVWMGLYALYEVKRGRMKWEEWLPDGLHPDYRGSISYAQSVINFLEKELICENNCEGIKYCAGLPQPINKNNWEHTYKIPFTDMKLSGPWTIRRWCHYEWIEQILYTSAIGARLSFKFTGRGLTLGFDFGRTSSEFKYKIDNGNWIEVKRDRPWWVDDMGWFRMESLADDLEYGVHDFELEVIHGNREECKGTNFRLAFAGVIE